jgi:hypothetical protein
MVYMHVEHAKAIVYMISSNTQLHLSVGVYVYIYICICTSCICLFWFSWMHFFLFRGKPATMDNPIWQSRPYTPQSVGLRIWLNYTCDSLALAVNKEELMGVNRFLIRQKGKFRWFMIVVVVRSWSNVQGITKIPFFNIQVPSKFDNFRLLLLHLFPGLL